MISEAVRESADEGKVMHGSGKFGEVFADFDTGYVGGDG
jgi:hypothetical protein